MDWMPHSVEFFMKKASFAVNFLKCHRIGVLEHFIFWLFLRKIWQPLVKRLRDICTAADMPLLPSSCIIFSLKQAGMNLLRCAMKSCLSPPCWPLSSFIYMSRSICAVCSLRRSCPPILHMVVMAAHNNAWKVIKSSIEDHQIGVSQMWIPWLKLTLSTVFLVNFIHT